MENREVFLAAISRFGVRIKGDKTWERLSKYCEMLIEKNALINLTAITDPAEIWLRHFADSLAVFPALKARGFPVLPERLIDVGCGAGFPGLPLKILADDESEGKTALTLLDSTGKKLDFVREVCAALRLSNVEILNMRAEEAARLPKHREGYGLVVSRAVADMRELCELCLPFVKKGGVFAAHKSRKSEDELARAANAAAALGGRPLPPYEYFLVPGGTEYLIALTEKAGPTPRQYPRAYARIKKNPL